MSRHALSTLGLIVLAALGLALGGRASNMPVRDLPATMTAPAGVLPLAVERAGPSTVAAYRAALTHPDVLASVPCLCGCQQSLGHRNNLDCYIAGAANGSVTYSMHGVGCAVCQEITRIALEGARQGLSGPELKELVLSHYGVQS